MLFYVAFFATVFRHHRATGDIPLIVLFVLGNLASGGLLLFWKWHLLFVALVATNGRLARETDLVAAPQFRPFGLRVKP